MANNLDPRIVRVGVEVGNDLRIYTEPLNITATVTKTWDAIQNEAQVTIINLAKDVRNQLLTETSPYNLNYVPKKLRIEVGRASTGAFLLYEGDIIRTTVSQPPNIVVAINAKTLNYAKGRIVSVSTAENVKLKTISETVAKQLGLSLVFEATDRDITNFYFDGASSKLIQRLSELGGINVYADDKKLIVKDAAKALAKVTHKLSAASGMIGEPELTDIGVWVRFFCDPNAQLGGSLQLESKLNPNLSGVYVIYAMTHVVATRDVPFYTIADCWRPGRMDLATGIPVLPTR